MFLKWHKGEQMMTDIITRIHDLTITTVETSRIINISCCAIMTGWFNCCDQAHQPRLGFCNIPKIVTACTVKLWCLHGSDMWQMGQLFRCYSLIKCHRPIFRCCFTVTPTMFSKAQVFLTDLFCSIFFRRSEFYKQPFWGLVSIICPNAQGAVMGSCFSCTLLWCLFPCQEPY